MENEEVVKVSCEICKKEFDKKKNSIKRFCSKECTDIHGKNKWKENYTDKGYKNSKEVGDIAQAGVTLALLRIHKTVLIPYGDKNRYDLAIEENGKFSRVQCKTGSYKNGCVNASLFSTYYLTQTSKRYNGEVEYFGIYCERLNKVYLIPIEDVKDQSSITLRVEAPKNAQVDGVTWAKKYEI